MKRKMLATLLASALAMSVAPAAMADSPTPRATDALITVVHAVPNFKADIWVNNSKALPDVAPKTVTAPIPFEAGDYMIEVKPAGSGKRTPAVLSLETTLSGGEDLSVVAGLRPNGNPKLFVFSNDTSAPTGDLRLFVAHVAAYGAVNVWANGSSLADGVKNGQSANFEIPAGTYGVWVAPEGKVSPAVIGPIAADLPADTHVAVYAFGPTKKGKTSFIVAVRSLLAP